MSPREMVWVLNHAWYSMRIYWDIGYSGYGGTHTYIYIYICTHIHTYIYNFIYNYIYNMKKTASNNLGLKTGGLHHFVTFFDAEHNYQQWDPSFHFWNNPMWWPCLCMSSWSWLASFCDLKGVLYSPFWKTAPNSPACDLHIWQRICPKISSCLLLLRASNGWRRLRTLERCDSWWR